MFNRKLLILWFSSLLLLIACTNQTPPPVQPVAPEPSPTLQPTGRGAGGLLRLVYWDAPTLLNPHLPAFTKDSEASRITYEPLASFDKENQLVPILAAEIPTKENGGIAADGKSVTWKLKENIFWSDGEPFTAADVKFTFEFATNPEVRAASKTFFEAVESVTVVDDNTVTVNFKYPTLAWSVPFVGHKGVILPKHKFEACDQADVRVNCEATSIPVGTGPYRVKEPGIKPQEIIFEGTRLIRTNKIVFEPNSFFREEDKPYFSQIELRGGGTVEEAIRLVFHTDEADYAWNLNIPPDDLASLEGGDVGRIVPNFLARLEQIELNQTDPDKETPEHSSLENPHPFFSDPKVRQALAYAINRDAIVELYGASGKPAHHLLVAQPEYQSENLFYEFDLKKAATLLDEAGWKDTNGDGIRDKDGIELNIKFRTTSNAIERQAGQEIIQKDLRSIGVDMEFLNIDASIFFGDPVSNPESARRFEVDLQEGDFYNINPDPSLYLGYWTCAQIPQEANKWTGFNYPRWCNETYDQLQADSLREINPEKRRQIFAQMSDLIIEEVAIIPLVHRARISGAKTDLEGLNPTPWDTETWNIKDWRRSSNDSF